MSTSKILVDGDILLFKCGCPQTKVSPFSDTQDLHSQNLANAQAEYDYMISHIATVIAPEAQILVTLTKGQTFRHRLAPSYKAHRPPKPPIIGMLRNWVEHMYDVLVIPDLEADDVLGLNQADDTVIASIDKDLLQIPGRHYNWKTDSFFDVTIDEGRRMFYQQILSGDAADNIKGCKGIGPKKAKAIVEGMVSDESLWRSVCYTYYQAKMTADDALLNARLVYILHPGDDPKNPIWEPPCPPPDPLQIGDTNAP